MSRLTIQTLVISAFLLIFSLPAQASAEIDSLNAQISKALCTQDSVAYQLLRLWDSKAQTNATAENSVQLKARWSDYHYCRGDLREAIAASRQAYQLASHHELDSLALLLSADLGNYYQSAGNFDSSTYFFLRTESLAVELSDSIRLGGANIGLGTNAQQIGELDKAMRRYFKALEVGEAIQEISLIIAARLNIATYYYDHEPEKLNTADFLELLHLAQQANDPLREVSIYEWLGYLKADSGDYEQSLAYFEKGREVNQKIRNQHNEILLLQGISYLYNLAGDHHQSITTNNELIALAKTSGYHQYLPSIYANNVSNYLALKQYENAIRDGLLAEKAGASAGQVELYYKVLPQVAEAMAAAGDHAGAYKMQQHYSELAAQVLNDRKTRSISELETKYETAKKEAQIESLSQQAAIQHLQLRQRNQLLIISFVLVLLVGVVSFFVIRERNAKKQRDQQELEHRFLRSQLNPHFLFNALLAIQNYMLKNTSQQAAIYLSKFSRLMREILESSRQKYVTVSDEVDMLSHYLDIHKLRLQDRFEYEIKVSPSISPEVDTLPPMFVQPFVENAIEHGVSHLPSGGRIEICFEKSDEHIEIAVTDNGPGIQPQSSKGHESLGSTIIRDRMALFNTNLRNHIQLKMRNITDPNGEVTGTKVKLRVPFDIQ